MKHIHQVLKEITAQAEFDIPFIDKFLTSKRGPKFIARLGRTQIDILEKEFGIKHMYTTDPINKLGLWLNRAKKLGLTPPTRNTLIKNYGETVKKMKEEGLLKLPKSLTKEEIYNIDHPIIRDKNGKPVQAKDRRGRLLWNNKTNTPIYKRKRNTGPSRGLPEALKCHMYEMHKMAKWDRKNPTPGGAELNSDFFPGDLMAAHRTRRMIVNEHIRDMLAKKYCHTNPKRPILRMFSVHTSTGYNGQRVDWEQECDPYVYGYPFTSYNSWPSIPDINSKLQRAVKDIADNTVVGLKVYDMFGNERARIAAQSDTHVLTRTISQC